MKNFKNKQKGFTLLETLVAIFILLLALTSLFSLTSSNFFSSRYARNESTAVYLAQEAIDYVRNDRDTTAFQAHSWSAFIYRYGDTIASNCYSANGCTIDATDWSTARILPCTAPTISPSVIPCQPFLLNVNSNNGYYYTYTTGSVPQSPTNIRRQVKLKLNPNNPDELQVAVTVEWQNGNSAKSLTLRTSLLKWQL
jgi:prepilin-type N-terminal cleavage/methylation domain-containing protein